MEKQKSDQNFCINYSLLNPLENYGENNQKDKFGSEQTIHNQKDKFLESHYFKKLISKLFYGFSQPKTMSKMVNPQSSLSNLNYLNIA